MDEREMRERAISEFKFRQMMIYEGIAKAAGLEYDKIPSVLRAKFIDTVSELFQYVIQQDDSEISQDATMPLMNSAAGKSTSDPERGTIALTIIKKIVLHRCRNIPEELMQRFEDVFNEITEDERKKREKNT